MFPRREWILVLAALIALAVPGGALAQIGEPLPELVAQLDGVEAAGAGDGFVAADGFSFAADLRSDLVYSLSGEGTLTAENIGFLSALVGVATGYGEGIAQPVANFLGDRASELAGLGPNAIGVEEYQLELDVTGDEEPFDVAFTLSLPEVPAELLRTSAHSLGPDDASFVIRKFSDFQCPYCAAFATQVLPRIEEELLARGDVRFEFHHLPLRTIHANAVPAAEASECVAEVGGEEAFWAFHDQLFERQRAWSGLGEAQPYFVRLAGELGVDSDGVADCLAEGRYAEDVADAYQYAVGTLGLNSTPTVFVNGYQVGNNQDLGAYLQLIELADAFQAP